MPKEEIQPTKRPGRGNCLMNRNSIKATPNYHFYFCDFKCRCCCWYYCFSCVARRQKQEKRKSKNDLIRMLQCELNFRYRLELRRKAVAVFLLFPESRLKMEETLFSFNLLKFCSCERTFHNFVQQVYPASSFILHSAPHKRATRVSFTFGGSRRSQLSC